ncbi:nucleobase:cation symporter-1, NCS1 family [Candidatus Planktophila vernalis]|uniref:Nucleobase:cation symporter-1, NCS1 family n=1 Tax=Candidatus Planktophila vernalis TaxID=1884907 RepID=A0A249KSS9_9ACTN|nr:cytosine permease [Candidatus Planktophila vernalis]ASY19860.1 nucleobase:cation symporter-1, NCS1 family [Candidatus Planktophila vernalis]
MPIFELELNGPNLIQESERRGSARSLFWPWAGANVSLLALSYGSFFLGFGISFRQATWAAIIGTICSFFLVGISSLAGKRSNAPTMVLARASFGVKGSIVPGFLSYFIFVGWETVLVSLATLATGTVFSRIGGVDQNLALILGFVIAVSLTVFGGVLGLGVIMKLQKILTVITVVMTVVYIALTIDTINWSAVTAIKDGSTQGFIGALIFGVTGIGLGWVNCAADYSRYLPRSVSSKAVVGWTVFGASIVPIILVIYGAALSASSKDLSQAIAMDPIGALTSLLPTWFLIPFALVAILGLVGGAILDLYSSGLALVSIGVPIKRHQAAIIDAFIMLAGSIYIVWVADNFFYPFQGFLITLGVPVAVWSAIFVADVIMRKKAYSERDLYDPQGMYGSINKGSIILMIIGTIVGWGLVTNTFASWLSWQGYLLFLIGGKEGAWAYANVGVIAALVIGFTGHILLSRKAIRAQESV